MIVYKGKKTINKVPFICFANDAGQIIEIPVDTLTAERFSRYLDKIAEPVVAGKVESEDDYDPSDV